MMYTKFIPLIAVLLLVSGCATPTSRLNDLALSHMFERQVINTDGYEHLVYTRNLEKTENVLRVYLEGDGSPWMHRVVVMPDPTPRNPLALRLMAKDEGPVAYVGRPCYNGTSEAAGCDSTLWTSGRYSPKVVRSMTKVIAELVERHNFESVALIGHSGGGALAMLIAPKITAVEHVVTIAGNLDTDAWTQHHGYTRLYTSLNPADQPELPPRVKQWHFVGGRDGVVPPSIVNSYVRSQQNALGISVDSFSHSCCWEKVWGDIARGIRTSSPGYLPGRRFKVPYR